MWLHNPGDICRWCKIYLLYLLRKKCIMGKDLLQFACVYMEG